MPGPPPFHRPIIERRGQRPGHARRARSNPDGGGVRANRVDIVARLVVRPAELPIGIMTALLGAPFFLHMQRGAKGGFNG